MKRLKNTGKIFSLFDIILFAVFSFTVFVLYSDFSYLQEYSKIDDWKERTLALVGYYLGIGAPRFIFYLICFCFYLKFKDKFNSTYKFNPSGKLKLYYIFLLFAYWKLAGKWEGLAIFFTLVIIAEYLTVKSFFLHKKQNEYQ